MQQRYYDPIAGRFLSVDPVTTDDNTSSAFNRFNYANNNPYRFTDPDGREPLKQGFTQNWTTIYQAGGSTSGMSQSSRATAVTAGAALGGSAGAVAAAGCAGVTVGVCGLGGPAIIGAGIAGGALLGNSAANLVDWISGLITSSAADGADSSDEAVKGLTDGLPPESDAKGRPVKGHYVNGLGDPQADLDSLPGTTGANGQKTLPDGSVAGVHTSTTTGAGTLHINRPTGSQDVKIRYPAPKP